MFYSGGIKHGKDRICQRQIGEPAEISLNWITLKTINLGLLASTKTCPKSYWHYVIFYNYSTKIIVILVIHKKSILVTIKNP